MTEEQESRTIPSPQAGLRCISGEMTNAASLRLFTHYVPGFYKNNCLRKEDFEKHHYNIKKIVNRNADSVFYWDEYNGDEISLAISEYTDTIHKLLDPQSNFVIHLGKIYESDKKKKGVHLICEMITKYRYISPAVIFDIFSSVAVKRMAPAETLAQINSLLQDIVVQRDEILTKLNETIAIMSDNFINESPINLIDNRAHVKKNMKCIVGLMVKTARELMKIGVYNFRNGIVRSVDYVFSFTEAYDYSDETVPLFQV